MNELTYNLAPSALGLEVMAPRQITNIKRLPIINFFIKLVTFDSNSNKLNFKNT